MLYSLYISLLILGLKIAAFFHPKAKKAVTGRKDWEKKLKAQVLPHQKWIWMHCASLGEFEQGRPVFEALKQKYPHHKFALSFFSPSGYEIRKNYALADYVFYLPFDSKKNAEKLAQIFQPEILILVKYDYWFHLLKALRKKEIPVVVISAIFRENQMYFQRYGKTMATMLKKGITHFFVQDVKSEKLLKSIGIQQITISGDTRFDRVKSIVSQDNSLVWLEDFKKNQRLVVVGSSWEDDENLWVQFWNEKAAADWKLVIVPHEIKPHKIKKLQNSFEDKAELYSAQNFSSARVLIVDSIGFLSKIYAYADLAYVGGGFNKSGVHNTLEPAVFGVPVVIGSNYKKFNEVKMLKDKEVLFPIENYTMFEKTVNELMQNEEKRKKIHQMSKRIFEEQPASTQMILNRLDFVDS